MNIITNIKYKLIIITAAILIVLASGCTAPQSASPSGNIYDAKITAIYHNELYDEDTAYLYTDGTFIITQPEIRGGNLAGTYRVLKNTAIFIITSHGTVLKFDIKPGNRLKDPQGDIWIKQ